MGQNKTKTKRKLQEEDQTSRPSLKISLSKSASQESSANNSTVSTEHDNSPLKSRSTKKGKKDAVSEKKLQVLFERYADDKADLISVNGVMQFIEDLDLQADDVVLLVIAWHLKAKEMGTFTKEEFIGGLRSLGLDTLEKIRDSLDDLRSELSDETTFAQIYKFAFIFYKESANAKNIEINVANSLLGLLLPNRRHIPLLRQYLLEQTEYNVVNMDQWLAFLEFSKTVDDNFGNLEEDDAWPSLLDSFVEWVKTHKVDTRLNCGRSREENESAERSIGGVKSSKSESDG